MVKGTALSMSMDIRSTSFLDNRPLNEYPIDNLKPRWIPSGRPMDGSALRGLLSCVFSYCVSDISYKN